MIGDKRSASQVWADRVTAFSGSWPFIAYFAIICVGWVVWNTVFKDGFDPYPFMFLNWFLTIVSTFQNPLIMLSQNRQNEIEQEQVHQLQTMLAEVKQEVRWLREKMEE